MSVLAHELRTPITTIYAGSAVLARESDLLPAMRQQLAADIHSEAARLFRAVEDLLVLTRLEHHALQVTREPVSFVHVVEAAVRTEVRRWPGLRVDVRSIGSPPPVAADPIALAHALRNLIANAGWRAIGPSVLDVVVHARRDRVECRILDRSRTLTRADLPGLFDLPTADPRPGVTSPGIALYIAARLVIAMRGGVWARPVRGGVAEIGLSLPRFESMD